LRRLARDGARAYYEGEIAERIAAHSRSCGGAMTLDDLRSYLPDWVVPIAKRYRGYDLHEIPPNGQGIAALIALGILEKFDLAGLPVDTVESQHLQIEAMKLAFADVYRYLADPRAMEVTPDEMLDDGYLSQRAKLIDLARAQDPGFGMPRPGGTVYLAAADESGLRSPSSSRTTWVSARAWLCPAPASACRTVAWAFPWTRARRMSLPAGSGRFTPSFQPS
jgi:gamma-glutamyltranspeptidase/glutathione hydrolase